MNCIKCGKILNEGGRYCPQCGNNVAFAMDMQKYNVKEEKVDFCEKCGTKSQGGRYCAHCGVEMGRRQFIEKWGIGFFTNSMKNVLLNTVVSDIKEKCTGGKKVDVKTTVKHGVVFAVCMLVFTLAFILIAQKTANLLPVFQTDIFENNAGLKDIKSYLLAVMYGIEVSYTGHIAATVSGGVKVFPILIGLTLVFVTISFFVMKKVSGLNKKCNMLELMIFSMVNSAVVTFCGLFFQTTAKLKKSEYTNFYEDVKLSLVTKLSVLNCFFMVFLVTLCLLVIVNGIKCKKEERNSTLLYAFRSNMLFVGVVSVFVFILCNIVGIKFSAYKESAFLFVPAIQAFFSAVAGLGYRYLMTVNNAEIMNVSMGFTNVNCKVVDLTLSEINIKWLTVVIGVLILFFMIKIVLDVLRILKNANIADTQNTIIELCKYSGGFALITAFITKLFAMYFKMTYYIPTQLYELQDYQMLNGKTVGISLGAGNVIGVFFKVFFFILIISLITLWLVKMNNRIMYNIIWAKKQVIMLVACVFVFYNGSVVKTKI